jgi:hypothetical protein
MRIWIQTVEESTRLLSPIGLMLIDDLTGSSPLGRVDVYLDYKDPGGNWQPSGIPAVITARTVITYPGLERRAKAGGTQRAYRVRVVPEFYIPDYRRKDDAIEFAVTPYNDTDPQVPPVQLPGIAILLPAPNYPFQQHIPVLRGQVKDAAKNPVPDCVVKQRMKEHVLTDFRGVFALPLRWIKPGVKFSVDAANERTGAVGTVANLQLPDALNSSVEIQIQ